MSAWIVNPNGPGWIKNNNAPVADANIAGIPTNNPPVPNANNNAGAAAGNNKNLRQWPLLPRTHFLAEQIREPPLAELARLPRDKICLFCYDELRNHVEGQVAELPCGHMFGKDELMRFLSAVDETRCFNDRCPKCLRVLHLKASPPGGAPAVVAQGAPPGLLGGNARGLPNGPPPMPVGIAPPLPAAAPVVRQMGQNWTSRTQRFIRRKALAYPVLVKRLDETILTICISWLLTSLYQTANHLAAFPQPVHSTSTFNIPIWDELIFSYFQARLAFTTRHQPVMEVTAFLVTLLRYVMWPHILLSCYNIYTTTTTPSSIIDAMITLIALLYQTLPTPAEDTDTPSALDHLTALTNTNRLNLGNFRDAALDDMLNEVLLDYMGWQALFYTVVWMGWVRYSVSWFFLLNGFEIVRTGEGMLGWEGKETWRTEVAKYFTIAVFVGEVCWRVGMGVMRVFGW